MEHHPLKDIEVLDFTQALAGPFATTLLADLGADVVKIEPPGGTSQRNMGVGELRPNVVRNKRSVVIDLKHESADDIMTPLVSNADVLIHNFAPGTMEKLGYDYDTVKEHNEEIVYVSLTGFGENGPYSERQGFDSLVAAMSGLFWNTGEPDRKPSKIGGNTIDVGTGMLTAFAAMAGLWNRTKRGEGQKIETSLFETAAMTVMDHYTRYSRTGETPTRQGHTINTPQPIGMFPTADEPLWLTCPYQSHWERLCGALGKEAWIDDDQFETMEDRCENREQLHKLLEKVFSKYSREELVSLLHDAGVPSGEVQTLAEAAEDKHLRQRGTIQPIEDVDGKEVLAATTPIHFSKTPRNPGDEIPIAGAHTREVLVEFGLSEADINHYISDGVISSPDDGPEANRK